jgi:HAD superfamily hydrolase (TIGR01509 family)
MPLTDSMFRGVIFDLDGVIVDSHPLHKRAWRSFLAYVGKEVTESELEFILEGRPRREILIYFLGELSDAEIQEYGNKKDEFFRQVSSDLKPISGSVEFIKNLKRAEFCMGVATSASRQRARWTLQQLDVEECFEVVVTGDDVVKGKPDPAIYRVAAERLSLSPEFLFAIEDSVSGLRSAKSAGFRCIGIAVPENADPLIKAGAEHVVPNLVNLSLRDLGKLFSRPARRAQHTTFASVSQ